MLGPSQAEMSVLEYLLRLNRIRTMIHTGLATEVGILPTAWHAVNLGFFVVVPRDCVGPTNKEHHAEAMSLLSRLAIVLDPSEIARPRPNVRDAERGIAPWSTSPNPGHARYWV